MKRILAILLVLLAVLSVSCRRTQSSGDVTEIVFWSSMSGNNGRAETKIVDGFNASQNRIKVTNIFQGNYFDMTAKLQAAVAAGDAPHLVMLEMARIAMFADLGILYDMTDLARTAGINTSEFFPALMNSGDWGQGLFAIPHNRSTPMFYYNKEMFAEVGLDPESPPRNWTELYDYAKRLSIPNQRWGYVQPIDTWFYEAWIFQSGGTVFNADNTDIGFHGEIGLTPLRLWKQWIAEGVMKPPPGQEYNAWDAAKLDFQAGVAGMIVVSAGDYGSLRTICDFEIGTAFLPANIQYGVPTGGANIAMLNGHEEDGPAAMEFLRYLTSPEPVAIYAIDTGYVPTTPAAVQTRVYQDFLTQYPAASTVAAQLQQAAQPRPNHKHYTQIHTETIMFEIQRCVLTPNYTPEQAVQEISRQVRALLASR